MKHRSFTLASLALLSLGLGTLVYLIRPAGSSYLSTGTLHLDAPFLLPWLSSLPSFFHVLAFALLTACALGLNKERFALSCFSWLGIGVLFELGQHEGLAKILQDLPSLLGAYFQRGTFDPNDLLACTLGAAAAYFILSYSERNNSYRPNQQGLFRLIGLASLALLTGCPITSQSFYHPELKIVSSSLPSSALDYGALCPGDKATLDWTSEETADLRLNASPPENLEPPLANKFVEAEGKLAITFKDDVVISLSARGSGLSGIILEKAPSAVCDDFELPLLGWYKGTFEQTEPERLSQTARIQLYWDGDTLNTLPSLKGFLYLEGQAVRKLNCAINEADKVLDCTQMDGLNSFSFSASGIATGLSGSYERVEESAPVRLSFLGKFEMLKQDAEPPPL